KSHLPELVQALDISLDGARNNPERISLIQAQLDGLPQLKDDPKFTGLYGRLPGGQKHTHASMVDENAALGPAELLLLSYDSFHNYHIPAPAYSLRQTCDLV
ncbi:hypothetical protein BDR04DRAFT_1087062, partial [Suillus decipiens]